MLMNEVVFNSFSVVHSSFLGVQSKLFTLIVSLVSELKFQLKVVNKSKIIKVLLPRKIECYVSTPAIMVDT